MDVRDFLSLKSGKQAVAQVYIRMREFSIVFQPEHCWQAVHRVTLGGKVCEVAMGRHSERTGKGKELN